MRRQLLVSVVAFGMVAVAAAAVASSQDTSTTLDGNTIDLQTKEADLKLKQQQLATQDIANKTQEIANKKATLDLIPSSSTTGAVTTKDNSGQAEATALAAATMPSLAKLIATDAWRNRAADNLGSTGAGYACQASDTGSSDAGMPGGIVSSPGAPALGGDGRVNVPSPAPIAGATPPTPAATTPSLAAAGLTSSTKPVTILLTAGADKLSFAHWDQFQYRYCKILSDYQAANAKADDVSKIPVQPGGFAPLLVADAAVKLAQLAVPDWDVSFVKADVSNRTLLLEVGRALRIQAALDCGGADRHGQKSPPAINCSQVAIYWQAPSAKLQASGAIFADLDKLEGQNVTATGLLAEITKRIPKDGAATTPAKGKKGKAKPAVSAATIAQLNSYKDALNAVIAAHEQLAKDLASTDAAASMPIGSVISEAAAAQILGSDGLVLNVNVDSSGGTGLARKVIWNVFSPNSPPFYVSGTTAVSYALVRPADQLLLSSASFTCSSGTVRLNKVRTTLQTANTAALKCDKE